MDDEQKDREQMSDPQYKLTQELLLSAARTIGLLDLPAFKERIEIAQAAGPVLDPTLYREYMDNLKTVERLADAAMPLWREAQRFKAQVESGETNSTKERDDSDGDR